MENQLRWELWGDGAQEVMHKGVNGPPLHASTAACHCPLLPSNAWCLLVPSGIHCSPESTACRLVPNNTHPCPSVSRPKNILEVLFLQCGYIFLGFHNIDGKWSSAEATGWWKCHSVPTCPEYTFGSATSLVTMVGWFDQVGVLMICHSGEWKRKWENGERVMNLTLLEWNSRRRGGKKKIESWENLKGINFLILCEASAWELHIYVSANRKVVFQMCSSLPFFCLSTLEMA